MMYRGNGAGWWVTGGGEQIGSQFNMFNAIVETRDWSGDGKADLLARKPGGTLFLYRGNGLGGWVGGVGEGSQIGNQFDMYDALITPGDWTGDGKDDLLARKPDGTLFLYRGNGAGGWTTGLGEQIGSYFNMFDIIVAPGDWSGDGKADLLARKPDGTLFLYRGDGAGSWLAGVGEGTQIGSGFDMFDALVAPGDWTGDGKADLLARKNDGTLFLYRGNGNGGWQTGIGESIGTNFNAFDAMVTTGTETYYPTSWAYGGWNHSVDTDDEILALLAAMRTGAAETDALWEGLSPKDKGIVPARFPTSWNYGGGNRSVDVSTEGDAVVAAMVAGGSSAAADAIAQGLTPTDRDFVRPFVMARLTADVQNFGASMTESGTGTVSPTTADIAAHNPGGAAAAAAGHLKCKERYAHGPLGDGDLFLRFKWCYNKMTERASYGNVNVVTLQQDGSGDTWNTSIINRQPSDSADVSPCCQRAWIIENTVDVQGCVPGSIGGLCRQATHLLRGRGNWDGSYRVRFNGWTWGPFEKP